MTNITDRQQSRTDRLAHDPAGVQEAAALRRLDESLDRGHELAPDRTRAEDGTSAEWIRLHRLLRMPDVPVPAGFADGVMARIRESSRSAERSRRSSIVVAVVGFVALAVVALLVRPADAAGDTVFGALASALVSGAVAGAGLLTATWSGVGETVGSWLGTSPTAGAILATLCVASLATLALLLRRRGAASVVRRD